LKSSSRSRRTGNARGRWLALIAAVFTWLIPRPVGYWLVDRLAGLAYRAAGRYRRAVLANVSQVLGRPADDPRVRAAARRCFETSARNFWDLCCLPHTHPGGLLRRTRIDPAGWAVLRAALARGRGVVVVTGHLGSFDSVGQLLTLLPSRPMILTAQTTAGWLFDAVTWLRASWGASVETPSPGSLRRILAHLRSGGLIGLVTDRDVERTGRPVWFFGRPATLPVGAARMALETGAALLAVFCPRAGEVYHLLVEEVPVARTGDAGRDLEATLAGIVAVLERFISTWPDQWVLFDHVWLDEAGAPRPAAAAPPVARPTRATPEEG
jgi:KDO2-lipid IV(A) lauroyltransferase